MLKKKQLHKKNRKNKSLLKLEDKWEKGESNEESILESNEIWKSGFLESISDIQMNIDGKIYKLHKMIFINSNFFKTMLSGKFSDDSLRIIEIYDVEQKLWEILLQYLYTKLLHQYIKQSQAKFSLTSLNITELIDLYILSDRYMITCLSDEILIILPQFIIPSIQQSNYQNLEDILEIIPLSCIDKHISLSYDPVYKKWTGIDWKCLFEYPRCFYYILVFITNLDLNNINKFIYPHTESLDDLCKLFNINQEKFWYPC